jgi:hypothetical protein
MTTPWGDPPERWKVQVPAGTATAIAVAPVGNDDGMV